MDRFFKIAVAVGVIWAVSRKKRSSYTGPHFCVTDGLGRRLGFTGDIPGGPVCGEPLSEGDVMRAVDAAWQIADDRSSGRPLTSVQKNNIKAILGAWNDLGDGQPAKLWYILATALHESDFLHLKEKRFSPDSPYYENQTRYWDTGYMGRGFAHITWQANYAKFGKLLGIDLVGNPALAETPSVAAIIIVYGMYHATFTNRALGDYIGDTQKDYYNSRKIINALSKAKTVQAHAENIEAAFLSACGYACTQRRNLFA